MQATPVYQSLMPPDADIREQASGMAYQAPISMGRIRSPLRYPGGKSRAVSTVLELMPPMLGTLVSPFFGGGSIELALAGQGVRVYGYDAFKPLVRFWQEAIASPIALANQVAEYYPMGREDFYALQAQLRGDAIADSALAAVFYALNRSSFSGTTLSGGMSPDHQRFTPSSIERLRNFDSHGLLSVEHARFETSLAKHKGDFLYCDPPYANGGALYGQKGDCHIGFDHQALARILTARDGWILSYNDCSLVRALYDGFTILPAEWTYGMSTDKKSNEILILSQDLRGYGYS